MNKEKCSECGELKSIYKHTNRKCYLCWISSLTNDKENKKIIEEARKNACR